MYVDRAALAVTFMKLSAQQTIIRAIAAYPKNY